MDFIRSQSEKLNEVGNKFFFGDKSNMSKQPTLDAFVANSKRVRRVRGGWQKID